MIRETMADAVSDYEALVDAGEYMKSEKDALEEQVVSEPSKYSMSYDDFKD